MSTPITGLQRSFVLLDDCDASTEQPCSRLYTDHVKTLRVTDSAQLAATWAEAQGDMAAGLHACVLADYEWGAKLMGVSDAAQASGSLSILLFRTLTQLSSDDVSVWLAQAEGNASPAPAGVMDIRPSVNRAEFDAAIERIHMLIARGETYQVNYTYRLSGQAFGHPLALYRRLRALQPVAFGALMALPSDDAKQDDTHWVLSCSPELFLQHAAGKLITRPMKGTAARGGDALVDSKVMQWLAHDEKNRAENVMIVDLLRNDLGRVAKPGTVKVTKLFSVESYRTVHQMTSTVEAEIPASTEFPAILKAVFPCGSITGAPKHHTMELIAELETTPRGLYTGAIGWIDAPRDGRACGDFCLSVAIRTLTLGPQVDGKRAARLGVGGGITIDSRSSEEFEETQLKARFLTSLDPGFTLFETMRAERGKGIARLTHHLQRLALSARQLGFRFNEHELRAQLQGVIAALPERQLHRIRLDLAHDGSARITSAALKPLPQHKQVALGLSTALLPEHELALVNHKTSLRKIYDDAIMDAENIGAFDVLFFNHRGELTEGARSNVLVRLHGHWYTPPLESGLLPGVIRGQLLARQFASERMLYRSDLLHAQAIAVCSSLRGLMRASLGSSMEPKI